MLEKFWHWLSKQYLKKHYETDVAAMLEVLQKDTSVAQISADEAQAWTEEQFTMGLTAEDRKHQWYKMGGAVGRMETLDDYTRRWRNSKSSTCRKLKRKRWFWEVPKRLPKLHYRPMYHDPIFEQMPQVSDLKVYKHMQENGRDTTPFFVVEGMEGRPGFKVACLSDVWKQQYIEEHRLDPNDTYEDV